MVNQRRGLGRGLQALIPENEEITKGNVVEIPINSIKPNKNQPRKKFDKEKIRELAASIKEYGIVQPIVVKSKDSNYVIIAGERRWRAANLIGLKKVPVVVKDYSEEEILAIALIENLQREDLNDIEEALAYKDLMDQFGLTQGEIAVKLGKSRTAITNTLRLLTLPKEIRLLIEENKLSAGHARAILALDSKELQIILANRAINEKLSVREVEKLAKDIKTKKKKNNIIKDKSPMIIDLEDQLQHSLGTKVTISHSSKKGKIEIEYYSNDDLERIIQRLKNK